MRLLNFLLKIYKNSLSFVLKNVFGGGCIYQARGKLSCSEYAVESVNKYGIIKGGMLAIKRFISCNPWHKI